MVNMNMNGNGVLGYSPKYKVNYIKEYLSVFPDVVFIQDCIEHSELFNLLDTVSDGKYEMHFQEPIAQSDDEGADDGVEVRGVTGIVWNRDKYIGSPLLVDDVQLTEFAPFLKQHNLTVVKLDSIERVGAEDMYPSFIAIAWHGAHYDVPLRARMKEAAEFFNFLGILRKNNWHIPLLIGGDYNMDMKSYDLSDFPELMLVPYRPISGSLAKDLKNTFIFTMDTLQVCEAGFKLFHPEIFASPFISIKVRGRTMLRLWAIVKIQRAMKRYLRLKREREKGKKKQAESKRRWKKKIEGEDYVSDVEEIEKPKPRRKEEPRRKSFSADSGNGSLPPDQPVQMTNHRRRRYAELKSIYDRKKEEQVNQFFFRPL